MVGKIFITRSGYDPQVGKHIKDPYLGPRPTLGACRPDVRRLLQVGDHIFVISGRVPDVNQFVMGGFEIASKIPATEAYHAFPELRLRRLKDGQLTGNIIVDSRGEQHALDDHSNAHVFPNHPVGIERLRAIFHIKSARGGVLRLHVDADPQRLQLHEPSSQRDNHLTGNTLSTMRRDNVNPFQLALASMARRAMTRNEPNHGSLADGHESCSMSLQRLLCTDFPPHIVADALFPISLSLPLQRANRGHRGNVASLGSPDHDRPSSRIAHRNQPRQNVGPQLRVGRRRIAL